MLTRAKLGLEPGDFAVLAVGELNRNKNHSVLIEAMAQLPANVKLFIAGVGPLHDELAALADRLGVADRVELLGFRSDVPALLNACDLFCMPSLREGLPVSLIEAAASGTLCLASQIRGCTDVLGGCEYTILSNEVSSWATTIFGLIDNAPERLSAATKQKAWAECFALGNVLKSLCWMYESASEATE